MTVVPRSIPADDRCADPGTLPRARAARPPPPRLPDPAAPTELQLDVGRSTGPAGSQPARYWIYCDGRPDLDADRGLLLLREKGGTTRWQPISLDLATRLAEHAQLRGAVLPTDTLLRDRNGRPLTGRRYDHLWHRLGQHLPGVAAHGVTVDHVVAGVGERGSELLDTSCDYCGRGARRSRRRSSSSSST